MAHFEKYHIKDVKKLLEHDNRTNTDERENVDKSRSHLNYNLHDVKDEYKFFRDKLEYVKQNGGTVRADSVVMISEIVTLPEDYPDNEEMQRQFFKGAYELAIKKYGKENIISAWVHCDEAKKKDSNTLNKPHIHIKILPIMKVKKKYKNGTEKERLALNANKILTPNFLKSFHNELDQFLEDWLGFKTSVHTGITKEQGGHKEIKELKKESERLKKQKEYINKDAWLIIAEQKKIINEYWKDYKNISQSYWTDYKAKKQIISNSIWELKKEIRGAEKELQQGLDFIGNMSYGLLYAVFKLIGAFSLLHRENVLQRELKALESEFEALETTRRKVSNYQHNAKEKLSKSDLEGIEEALENWEKVTLGMNAKMRDTLRQREEDIQIPQREKEDILEL